MVIDKILERNSSFHVKWREATGSFFLVFGILVLISGGVSILGARLGAGLKFCKVSRFS